MEADRKEAAPERVEAEIVYAPVVAETHEYQYNADAFEARGAADMKVEIGKEVSKVREDKVYRGMGSIAAMENGSKDRYFQENAKKLVPEGVEGRVAYKGTVEDTVFQLIGGIRSGMGYCGAKTIEDLKESGRFVKISAASLKESHPHDIHITKEAPNYSVE